MIVLHAGVVEGQMTLWGEAPADPQFAPGRPPRRKQNKKGKIIPPEVFPYDAGGKGLQTALLEAGVGFPVKKKSFAKMIAWLPTANNTPVPSSPLIADPPQSDGKTTFAPWAITGFPLSSEQALEFLCASMGKQTLAPGIIIGKDLEFLGFSRPPGRVSGSQTAISSGINKRSRNLRGPLEPGLFRRRSTAPHRIGESHAGSFPGSHSLGEKCRPSPRWPFLPIFPLRSHPIC